MVYADIPYEGTAGYVGEGAGFDHTAFYRWCSEVPFPVFVSSYQLPPDFVCISRKEKKALFSQKNAGKVSEGLFVHRNAIQYL